MTSSRVPCLHAFSFEDVHKWFSTMQQKELLFHPDDDPAEIICIKSGNRLFTPRETVQLRSLIDTMFERLGSDVYEAAFPVFRAALLAQ